MTRISMTFAAATMTISLAQVARSADVAGGVELGNLLPKELLVDFHRDVPFAFRPQKFARN